MEYLVNLNHGQVTGMTSKQAPIPSTPWKQYATPIWTPASISVKRKLDSVQHRAAKIIIGAVSSINNEKAEQECGLPPLESRRKLATIKFTNKLRSYGAPHSKNPPKNTWFRIGIVAAMFQNRRPCNSQTKGLETIAILSQDNFLQSPTPMVPQTDPSAMEVPESSYSSHMILSKSAIEAIRNGETNISCDIITLLEQLHNKRKSCILQWIPAHVNIEVTECDCPRIITSTIARWRTEHLKGMKIHPDKTRSYVQCKHCPDLQLTPNHNLECPTVATKLLKMGMVPLRDSLRELLYSPDAPRIAEAVIKTFDGT
ncbi:RNase H domain-containing protein [Trichonephila clavipes]|nr:RNase H domain-containing protein [Trichonephila clavipes]